LASNARNATPLVFPAPFLVYIGLAAPFHRLDSNELIPPLESAPPAPPSAPETQRSGENPVFNLWDVVLILVVAALAQLFCLFFAALVFYGTHPGVAGKTFASNVLVVLPAQVAGYFITVAFMVLLVWQKYRTDFLAAVKWNMPSARFAWGAFGVGAALAVATQALSAVLQPWIPKSLPIDQVFHTATSAYALAAFGTLVAPFVEEMFFRGFLFPALARPLGILPAASLTAAGFALIHGAQLAYAWIPLLLLFMVGMVLTLARARMQSVAVSVLMHIGYNSTLFAALYIATQGFRHMERG
jgi:uncharacterized protein